MPAKKYIVSLTKEEQKSLEDLTKTGKAAAAKINHAKILLKADINREEGGWKDQAISIALDTSVSTIEQVRQRFVEEETSCINIICYGEGLTKIRFIETVT